MQTTPSSEVSIFPYCLHYFFLCGKKPQTTQLTNKYRKDEVIKKKMPVIKYKQQSVKGNLPGIIKRIDEGNVYSLSHYLLKNQSDQLMQQDQHR